MQTDISERNANLLDEDARPKYELIWGKRMSRAKIAFKYLLAIIMFVAGTMHFLNPQFYMTIMPPYLPLHLELVYVSGLCEVTLGVLLVVPRFSRLAAWGICALLIAVFPANIYLYQHQELVSASPMVHFLRLLLQGVLLLWAYWHSRPIQGKSAETVYRKLAG